MADRIETQVYNVTEFGQALGEAPQDVFTFAKQELGRGIRRFRKTVIRERMSGGAGLDWKNKPAIKGKIRAFAFGDDLSSLGAQSRISRLLRVHEEGATITAKNGGYLYLSRKTGKSGRGAIFARLRSVTIPARLGFVDTWNRVGKPDLLAKLQSAIERGFRVAMERRMKALQSFVSKVAAA